MIENSMVVDSWWRPFESRNVYCECDECGCDIEYEEKFYRINGNRYCVDCIENYACREEED